MKKVQLCWVLALIAVPLYGQSAPKTGMFSWYLAPGISTAFLKSADGRDIVQSNHSHTTVGFLNSTDGTKTVMLEGFARWNANRLRLGANIAWKLTGGPYLGFGAGLGSDRWLPIGMLEKDRFVGFFNLLVACPVHVYGKFYVLPMAELQLQSRSRARYQRVSVPAQFGSELVLGFNVMYGL